MTATLLAQSAIADDWQYYQHDETHTGNSNAFVDPLDLTLAWTAPAGYATPLIVGNTVYATTFGGMVSSFDLPSGMTNWTYDSNLLSRSQAAVGGGFVALVGSPSHSGSSLYVLDATTGTFRYAVPVPGENANFVMPTLVENPLTGSVTAYVNEGAQLSAVSLGPSSGSLLWTQPGSFGGQSIPTIVGNSIVLAGPGQYYAFDQVTGTTNHFWSGDTFGGGGVTVAYDATRRQFYVLEAYDTNQGITLSAYHYTDNEHITLLWQRSGPGIVNGASVAIGPDGKIYTAGYTVVWELDPNTGATLRSLPGSFAAGVAPALSKGVLWVFSNTQTLAYDLLTLQLLRSFDGSRGSFNSAYDSPGAMTDGYFILDYGEGKYHGFDVYSASVPEPRVIGLLLVAVAVAIGGRVQSKQTNSVNGPKAQS